MDLRISLFDHFRLETADGGSWSLRPRAQRLLAYLLLHRHRQLARDQVAFALWPDSPEPQALGSLRRAISDLRAALPDADRERWLIATESLVHWELTVDCWLDIDRFERLVRDGTPAALHQAVELYVGDLLASWDDEWLVGERERLRQRQVDTLRRLIAHHRGLGAYGLAADFARRALIFEPLAEVIHRELIAVSYAAGDRGAALSAYERLRATLADDLGVEPMAETQALRDAIARGDPLSNVPEPQARAGRYMPERQRPVPIGRDRELRVLDTLWESATDSRGRIAVVSGAAGIGKSHLIQHFVERVEASGAQALIGHCYEFEQALPYQAPAEMLRSAGHLVRHADLASAHRSALALLVPDVLEVSAGPGDLSSEDLRSQVFEALFQAFLALSRSQPLLIVVEDVHWASESMLDWLTYIAPRLGDARMLVVVTHRTDEVDGNQPLARLHRRLARVAEVDNLLLAPLTAAEHRALVTRLAGLPEERVTPLADRLFAETAGNPFFLMEVVRSLIETGQITLEDGRWAGSFVDDDREIDLPLPDSIRDLVITRFERLGPVSQTFAQVASVAGRVFRYELVRDAATIADEPALAALDEVLQRGLIEQHDRAGDFRFSHHLIQEVTYAAMTAPRRAFWHGRLAEAILILQPDDVESLAHHFNRAGDDERARGYYAQAGDRAQQLAAFDDAARHYRAALNRWPEHDRAGRAGLFSKRGLCLWVLGEATAALESLDAGQALYDSLHDNLRVGDIERMIGRIHWEQGDRQTALDHYHRALAILEREPESVELARAVSAISQMHMLAAEFDEAIVWGERALALAERLNAEDVAIHALINIGSSLTSPEESERGLTILRESLDRANAANLSHDAMRACHNLAERLVNLGQYTEAQEMNAALLEQARRVHSDLFTGVALQFLIQVNWLTGRWAEALRNREAILDWLRSSSPPRLTLIWAARVLGMLHNDLGQADVACQMLERELAAARDAAEEQTTVPHLAELARSYAALGRDADAAATVRELLGWIERLTDVSFNCITPLLVACRWYASGSTPSDLAALNRCVTWLERVATRVDTLESRVALAEGQGLAFLAEGEPAAAVEQLRLAVAGWELLGRPLDQARALSLLGNALSLNGHASDGRDAVDRARSICNELASQLTDPQLASSFRHSALRRSLHPER